MVTINVRQVGAVLLLVLVSVLGTLGVVYLLSENEPNPSEESARLDALGADATRISLQETNSLRLSPTGTAAPTPTLTPSPTPLRCEASEAAERVRRAVVRVETTSSYGTGLIIDPSGTVLTNAHVVGAERMVTLTMVNGQQITGQVVRTDVRRDLALVQPTVAIQVDPVAPADTVSLVPGRELLAWGYALGLAGEPSLTTGVYSGTRTADGIAFVQTDTPVNSGNSGGPLFTDCGEVIGIVTFKIPHAEGLGFAVSSREVKAFLASPSVAGLTPVPQMLGPAETVALFYSLLDQGSYEEAFGLLSSSYKGSIALETFINGYSTTLSVLLEDAHPVGPASVHVTVQATDLLSGQAVVRRFAGTWDLVIEDGSWKLNHGQIAMVE